MSWTPGDAADVDKFDTMASNDQWLFNNTPRAFDVRTRTSQGLVVACGQKTIAKHTKSSTAQVQVNFNGLFTARPLVTTTLETNYNSLIVCVVRGLHQLPIGTDGFIAHIKTFTPSKKSKDVITNQVNVNWMAIGVTSGKIQNGSI